MRYLLFVTVVFLLPLLGILQPATADEKADAINYFLVRSRWTGARMEREMSESTKLSEGLTKARRLFNDLKTQLLDSSDLPLDFRSKYLDMITHTLQFLDELNAVPQNTMGLIGLGVSNLIDKGKTGEKLRDRLLAASEKMKNSNEAMEKAAIQFGARTDWEPLPRITEVGRNTHAMRNGLHAGDFLFSIDGTKLFRMVPDEVIVKAVKDGRRTVEVRVLTNRGFRQFELPVNEPLGATLDLTGAEPTITVKLKPYTFDSGYYVHVTNYSRDTDLEDVEVVYREANGKTRSQKVGMLKAEALIVLDPSKIQWRVAKNETISVTAKGRVGRTIKTDRIIP